MVLRIHMLVDSRKAGTYWYLREMAHNAEGMRYQTDGCGRIANRFYWPDINGS